MISLGGTLGGAISVKSRKCLKRDGGQGRS
jgi:hypothetical protein